MCNQMNAIWRAKSGKMYYIFSANCFMYSGVNDVDLILIFMRIDFFQELIYISFNEKCRIYTRLHVTTVLYAYMCKQSQMQCFSNMSMSKWLCCICMYIILSILLTTLFHLVNYSVDKCAPYCVASIIYVLCLQGSYGIVKLAYSEENDTPYVSPPPLPILLSSATLPNG